MILQTRLATPMQTLNTITKDCYMSKVLFTATHMMLERQYALMYKPHLLLDFLAITTNYLHLLWSQIHNQKESLLFPQPDLPLPHSIDQHSLSSSTCGPTPPLQTPILSSSAPVLPPSPSYLPLSRHHPLNFPSHVTILPRITNLPPLPPLPPYPPSSLRRRSDLNLANNSAPRRNILGRRHAMHHPRDHLVAG